jgi:hypothetical protein
MLCGYDSVNVIQPLAAWFHGTMPDRYSVYRAVKLVYLADGRGIFTSQRAEDIMLTKFSTSTTIESSSTARPILLIESTVHKFTFSLVPICNQPCSGQAIQLALRLLKLQYSHTVRFEFFMVTIWRVPTLCVGRSILSAMPARSLKVKARMWIVCLCVRAIQVIQRSNWLHV